MSLHSAASLKSAVSLKSKMSLKRKVTVAGFAAVLAFSAQALPSVAHAAPAAAPAVRFIAADPTNPASTEKAADYLVSQFVDGPFLTSSFTGDPDPSGTADAIVALAASGTHQAETLAATTWLAGQASSFATNPGRAGKLAIAAVTMGGDPTDFGGVDLVSIITTALAATPDLADTFAQSFAIIALGRAGVDVPQAAVDALIASQDASGAFGYVDAWTDPDNPVFVSSPDTTGMALMALTSLPTSDAVTGSIALAKAWAADNLTAGGYWDAWSPANSAGLLGSALLEAGVDVTDTVSWMLAQQELAGGTGLPASLDGTDPETSATAQGMLLLAGVTLNTAEFSPIVITDPVDPEDPTDPVDPGDSDTDGTDTDDTNGSGSPTTRPLPDTGDSDSAPLGALLLITAAGAAALAAGRRR